MDYKKIHDNIINKARSENRVKGKGNYYEAHHILPRCMGGEGHVSQWKSHPNIILLTAREHFVIHKLLCEIYTESFELYNAYKFMMNGKSKNQNRYYNYSSKEYERVKNKLSELQSIKYLGKNNHRYGKESWNKGQKGLYNTWIHKKNHSEETILKMCENTKGEKNGFYGKKHSMEFKINRSNKIIIDGIEYYSIREASRILFIDRKTIVNRCKSQKFTNYNYA